MTYQEPLGTPTEPQQDTFPAVFEDHEPDSREYSRPMEWNRAPAGEPARRAVGELLDRMLAAEAEQKAAANPGRRPRAPTKDQRERLRKTLGAMVLELFALAAEDPDRYLGYGRRDSDYGPKEARYLPIRSSRRAVERVVSFLRAAGLIEHHDGFYNRFGKGYAGPSRRPRMRATTALVDLVQGYGLKLADIETVPGETIILKTPRGRPPGDVPEDSRAYFISAAKRSDYEDTPETRRMRETLERLNGHLERTRIELPAGVPEGKTVEVGPDGELLSKRLYRVFNNCNFRAGGRFYVRRSWQALSSEERAGLLIDGEPVAELDFASLHLRLAYHLSGQTPPAGDLYELPGWEDVSRKAVKRVATAMLNVSKLGKLRMEEVAKGLPPGRTIGELAAAIQARHPSLVDWFGKGRGLELQHLDSLIAEGVMLELDGLGVPSLPVHDSFVVPETGTPALRQSMDKHYRREVCRAGGAVDRVAVAD